MTEQVEPVQLSRMTSQDVPQVYTLERLCFSAPWDLASYYHEARNPNAYYLVARVHGHIVGYGGMWLVYDEGHVVNLAVHPDFRRHGIGRKLLRALLEEVHRRHIPLVTLEVRVGNTGAQHLYTSFGFRTIAFRRNYYPDNGEDAAVMALDLSAEEGAEA